MNEYLCSSSFSDPNCAWCKTYCVAPAAPPPPPPSPAMWDTPAPAGQQWFSGAGSTPTMSFTDEFGTTSFGYFGGAEHACMPVDVVAGMNPNAQTVDATSAWKMDENSSAMIYNEGYSIENENNPCSIPDTPSDPKFFYSPNRIMSGGSDTCMQELCSLSTKAYLGGGSNFRHPDNGAGCSQYIEGQYPNDPNMCDIYAEEQCLAGEDLNGHLTNDPKYAGVSPSQYIWDNDKCACTVDPSILNLPSACPANHWEVTCRRRSDARRSMMAKSHTRNTETRSNYHVRNGNCCNYYVVYQWWDDDRK